MSEDISLNGRLLVSGNVGIGLTNPNYALDVSSASNPFRVGVPGSILVPWWLVVQGWLA